MTRNATFRASEVDAHEGLQCEALREPLAAHLRGSQPPGSHSTHAPGP